MGPEESHQDGEKAFRKHVLENGQRNFETSSGKKS